MIFEGIGGTGGTGGTGGGGGGTIISGLDIGGIGGIGGTGGGGGKGILCTVGGGGGGTFFLVCEKAENDNNTQTINKFALKCFIIIFLV